MNLGLKLISTHLGVGLIPLLLIGIILWMIASSGLETVGRQGAIALETAAYEQLKSMREIKGKQIAAYFKAVAAQLHMMKDNPWVLQTLEAFDKAFKDAGDSIDSDAWRSLAKENDWFFQDMCTDFDWYDIFLVSHDGSIVYTRAKESDLGKSLRKEPLKSGPFGKAFEKLQANPDLEMAMGDFAPYSPSNNVPAAFLLARIRDGQGKVVAHVGLQLSTEGIRDMMEAGSNKKQTLEAYLVGPDGYMRSDSILKPTDYSIAASFKQRNKVDSEAVRGAMSGETGTKVIGDYLGNQVLSAWAPVDVFGIRWALICEIDATVAMNAKTVMADTIANAGRQLVMVTISVLIVTGFMVVLVAGFIARSISKPIARAAGVADVIASGNFNQRLNMQRSDEVGQMARALDGMAEALSKSFRRKNGIAELAERMRGEPDIPALARNVVTYLAKYLGAQMASLYLADKTGESLVLTGIYAFNKRKSLNERIKVGEGLAGQAAVEKSIISVTDVPNDYVRISSTLGDSAPRNILAAPCVYEGKLMGVFEFASFKEFSDTEIDFLNDVTESVAIVFSSARSRQEVQELLEETQRQSEELVAQTEELQSQQEELKASNEELEQQSEELRASNEELEEKTEALEQQKAEIEKRTAEVEEAKNDLEAKAQELELASRYKSEFLANMSHELRTPLNSLLILAKILADNDNGNLDDEQVESAEIIYSGGQDLLFLINEILDLSKVEAGMMEVHREEIYLDAFVDNMQKQFQAGAEDKGLTFKITVSPGTPSSIVTDGQRLEQILKNFLSNALKFTAHGSVTMDIGQPGEDARFASDHLTPANTLALSVRDTGLGISAEKQRVIFEAFQQADGSTSRQYGGTGLGLSIARSLARLLNGEIQVKSKEGDGSTFTLFLPLERRSKVEEEPATGSEKRDDLRRRAVRPEQTRPSSAPASEFLPDDRKDIKEGDRVVLIIEDDLQFAKILMGQVRKKDFKCLAAGEGGNGLQLAADYRPSAIILDLGLPDIDGATVLDGLKYDLATRHIPVHVISAREKTADIMQKGAAEYLTKPVDARDIEATLDKVVELLETPLRKVLIVEDDEHAIKAAETLLAAKNVEITGTGSGGEALKLIARGTFDCVILDLGLPDMTGFELLESLDADPSVELPPVIVYTGRELTSDELRELGRYTAKVVIKGANSPERLLDETSLFLHLVESSLPEGQKRVLHRLHDPEQLLQDRKVLLVDDDLRNSFALSKVLRRAGLDVVMAENGQVALDRLDNDGDIELVLMDVMMPVMDGYEATARIREQIRFKDLPVVALTAKAMVEDRAKCIQVGANDYLAKPIDTEKLISLMRVLLYR